jgi:lipopolysaccharide/colanic/teichoic acid biosynthesis glycosyltransferase
LWKYAPRIVSMDHVVKEDTCRQTWGTTIPSVRETHALFVKLAKRMFNIVSHIFWIIGNSFIIIFINIMIKLFPIIQKM